MQVISTRPEHSSTARPAKSWSHAVVGEPTADAGDVGEFVGLDDGAGAAAGATQRGKLVHRQIRPDPPLLAGVTPGIGDRLAMNPHRTHRRSTLVRRWTRPADVHPEGTVPRCRSSPSPPTEVNEG